MKVSIALHGGRGGIPFPPLSARTGTGDSEYGMQGMSCSSRNNTTHRGDVLLWFVIGGVGDLGGYG